MPVDSKAGGFDDNDVEEGPTIEITAAEIEEYKALREVVYGRRLSLLNRKIE